MLLADEITTEEGLDETLISNQIFILYFLRQVSVIDHTDEYICKYYNKLSFSAASKSSSFAMGLRPISSTHKTNRSFSTIVGTTRNSWRDFTFLVPYIISGTFSTPPSFAYKTGTGSGIVLSTI